MKKSEDIENISERHSDEGKMTGGNPEKAAEAGFIKRNIEMALDKLSARERTIFIMRNFNEMSFSEIEEVLKIQSGTVRSTNFKALKKLRKELSFYKKDV